MGVCELGLQPWAGAVSGLKRQVAARIGEFNFQDIANTPWAYAALHTPLQRNFFHHSSGFPLPLGVTAALPVMASNRCTFSSSRLNSASGQIMWMSAMLASFVKNSDPPGVPSEIPAADVSKLQADVAAPDKRLGCVYTEEAIVDMSASQSTHTSMAITLHGFLVWDL